MNVLIQAGEDAERLAAMFSGLAGVAAELKRVGSLQQAADEVQGRIDKGKAEYDAYAADRQAQIDAAEKRLAGLKEEGAAADRAIAEANAARSKLLAEATAETEEILAQARDMAAQLVEVGAKEASKLRATTEASLVVVKQSVADAQARLTDIERLVAQRQAVLDDINAKIAEWKARA